MPICLIRSALIAVFIFWSTQSLAGGAYIYEMANTTDIGTAGAGLAAKAQDASVVFNNPAGMTRIHQPEIQSGGTVLYLKAPFDSGSGTTITGPDSNTSEFLAGGWCASLPDIPQTYDFRTEEWVYAIGGRLGKVVKFGAQPVNLFGQVTYNSNDDTDEVAPEWSYKINMTILFLA